MRKFIKIEKDHRYIGLSTSRDNDGRLNIFFTIFKYSLVFILFRQSKIDRCGIVITPMDGFNSEISLYIYYKDWCKFIYIIHYEYVDKSVDYQFETECWTYSFIHGGYLTYKYDVYKQNYKMKYFGHKKSILRCHLCIYYPDGSIMKDMSFPIKHYYIDIRDKLNDIYLDKVKFTEMSERLVELNMPILSKYMRLNNIKEILK